MKVQHPRPTAVFLALLLCAFLVSPGTGPAFAQGVALEKTSPLVGQLSPLPSGEALLSLKVNGVVFGDVETRVNADGTMPFFRTVVLREAFAPLMTEAAGARIFGAIFARLEWVGAEELKYIGVSGSLNQEELSYEIWVPPDYAETQNIDFSTNPDPNTQEEIFKRASVAGVVNLQGSLNLEHTGSTLLAPAYFSTSGFLNVHDWIAEFQAELALQHTGTTQNLSVLHVVRDFPGMQARFHAGLVTGEGYSFMSRPALYGATLDRTEVFSLLNRKNSPSVKFLLDRPANVRVVMNGAVVKSLYLDSGAYRLVDLPFTYGLNAFHLEVEDGSGNTGVFRPLNTYVTTESEILVAGESEFSLTGGVGRENTSQPFGGGYIKYGLFYNLTLGGYGQADSRSGLAGLTAVFGTPIGTFSGEAASIGAWDGRSIPLSAAAALRYQYSFLSRPELPQVGLSAEYRTEGFSPPTPVTTTSIPRQQIQVNAQFGGRFTKSTTYGLSGNWSRVLDSSATEAATMSLNLGQTLSQWSSLSAAASASFAGSGGPDFRLSFTLSANSPAKSSQRMTMGQSQDGSSYFDINDKADMLGGLDLNLHADNPTSPPTASKSVSARVAGVFRTGMFSTSGRLSYNGTTGIATGYYNLTASTALSFADGTFAISRPLHDSFVVFKPADSIRGQRATFRLDASASETSDGAPVAMPITSYKPTVATMDFPDAAADIVATVPKSLLVPRLKSGILFTAGLSRQLIVEGRLVDGKGKPFKYLAGKVLNAGGEQVGETFTDDNGYFQIYGVTAGEYRIVWTKVSGETILLLEDSPDGIKNVGDLVAKEARE